MVTFNGASNLAVRVVDGPSTLPGGTLSQLTDYRWIIEEDRTFNILPQCEVNSAIRPAGCPPLPAPDLGVNFHTSYMPVVAAGCVGTVACEASQTVLDGDSASATFGQHIPAVCDLGNGACRAGAQQDAVDPGMVHLDPLKRYYISVLPGDAGNDFIAGAGAPVPVDPKNPSGPTRQFDISKDCGVYSDPQNAANWAPGSGSCGHGMGGANIAAGATAVDVKVEETPYPTTKVAV